MRRRAALALGTFLFGTFGSGAYLRREVERRSGGPAREVLRLVRDVSSGEKLEETALVSLSVPERFLDPRAIPAGRKGEVLGRRPRTSLKVGQLLFESDVRSETGTESLSEKLEPGRRAYQLKPEMSRFREELRPGDRVDVLVLGPSGVAEIVVERALVISGFEEGRETSSSPPGAPSASPAVALSLVPDEALKLFQAEGKGKLQLLLRHPSDFARRTSGSGRGARSGFVDEEGRP